MQIRTDTAPEQKFQGGTITIGNFDGLHLGHRALLAEAQKHGGPLIVLTFDPHPVQVLHPDRALKRLFPREDTAEQLAHLGFDLFVVLKFTRELAQLSADEFLQVHVLKPYRPHHLVVGHDFGLGQGRKGNIDFLKSWAAQHSIALHIVSAVKDGETVVSSGRIREALAQGDVELSARWLQRPFYLKGRAIRGDGRGTQLGFPTVNQTFENETVPATGVYVSALHSDGHRYAAVSNIGINPTFSGDVLKVESFILAGEQVHIGENVKLDLLKRLRAERKFAGPEDLKKQIERDILEAKAFHKTWMR